MDFKYTASITRPNNATQYAAGDVIGTASTHVLSFASNLIAKGANKFLYRAHIVSSESPATAPQLELWLFNKAPAAQADNAAFAVTDAEMLQLLGVIPMATSYVGLASGNRFIDSDSSTPIVWNADSVGSTSDLFGVLVVRNTYTPVANEVFTVDVFGMD